MSRPRRRAPAGPPTGASRPDRVGQVVREAITTALARGLKDPRVGAHGLVTVTRVRVDRDLRVATVGVVVHGADEAGIAATLSGLESARGFLRAEVGRRLRARNLPELRFVHDRGIDDATRIDQLLWEIHEEDRAREREAAAAGEPSPEEEGEGGAPAGAPGLPGDASDGDEEP